MVRQEFEPKAMGCKSASDTFMAAYSGTSMNPTLREPEMIEIEPFRNGQVHAGDVVYFLSPEDGQAVVHRIIRLSAAGIYTRGDNSARGDPYMLRSKDILGRVTAAWRGPKRRKIAGGRQGRLLGCVLNWRRILDRSVSRLLHAPYYALSRMGLIARLLPKPLQPRVVIFRAQGQECFRLLLGKKIIGRLDKRSEKWQIDRPYRLFTNERILPTQRTTDYLFSQDLRYGLDLADGSRWIITAANEGAKPIVAQLGSAMMLRQVGNLTERRREIERRLIVSADPSNPEALPSSCYGRLPSQKEGVVICPVRPRVTRHDLFIKFIYLSLVIARDAQTRGGLLLHGALAELDGGGVILAGHSGAGKTTANSRLAAPWRPRSDDVTLVVPDRHGAYWAHPWPTWSRFFMDGKPGGSWSVQDAVPLKGIFCLSQAIDDGTEEVRAGKAVSMLVEYVEQSWAFLTRGFGAQALDREASRVLRLEQFDSICALVRTVPVRMLYISLTGEFWREIEKVLGKSEKKLEDCVR